MSSNRRFTCVEVDYGEEETKNFGKRIEFSSPTSLYEVHTSATITEEENDENVFSNNSTEISKKRSPEIKCAGTTGVIAVVADSDLSVFDIHYGTKLLFTLHIPDIQSIEALSFLLDTDLLAAVCSNGRLYFISVSYRNVVWSVGLSEIDCLNHKTYITAKKFFGDCIITVCCGNRCYSLRLTDFETCLAVYCDQSRAHEIFEKLQETPVICTELNSIVSGIIPLPMTTVDVLTIAGGGIIIIDIINGIKSDYCADKSFYGFVQARSCWDSGISLLLTSDGYLVILDTLTCVILSKCHMLSDVIALDFVIISSGLQELSPSTKLVFLVKTSTETQFQIRNYGTHEMVYSVVISPNSLLLNNTVDDDGSVYFVEYVESKSRGDVIRLRSVFECQPELRLERMLNRCQFDEAERLAVLFNLDLQRVHKARANFLLSRLDSEVEEQKTFDLFLSCLDKIIDNNWVGESCCAGVTLCRSLDWIIALLQYAESRKITDGETVCNLNRLRYNLGTYRMLFGPEKATFDRDSAWNDFISDDLWNELFLGFCKQGCSAEARLLWGRYNSVLKPWMQNDFQAFLSFLDALSSYAAENMFIDDLLDLAEHEVLPVVLYSHAQKLSEKFFDWLLFFGHRLEMIHPEKFPENTLYVCSVMERTIKEMINSAVTPLQQAELAHALAIIRVDSNSQDCSMGRLNVYVRDLKEMYKLKKNYDCHISYDFYKKQTTESICHLILKRSKNAQHVHTNVTQYVIPYMEEFKLNVDQTLYDYILEVAQLSAGVVTNINPWDSICLAVAEKIRCHELKCKAVIGIARRAYPPWTKQLCTAVEKVLNDSNVDAALKIELQRQCDFAQLGQILMPYAVPFVHVEKLTSSNRYVQSLICFILRQQAEADIEERVVDCVKVMQLVEKLDDGVLNKVQCYTWCCKYIINEFRDSDMFSTLERFINALADGERLSVVHRVIDDVICETNCNFASVTQMEKDSRLLHINTALFLLELYCSNEIDYRPRLLQLKGVQLLQERFDMFVGCEKLDGGERKYLLEHFMSEKNNLHNTTQVLKFADFLTISLEETCIIAACIALAARETVLAIRYAMFALQPLEQASKQLLDVCMRCTMFALWNLHELAEKREFDQLFILVEALTAFSKKFVEASVFSGLHHHQALVLSGYISLFVEVIEQCHIDEGMKQNECQQMNVAEQNERSEIYGMNRRLGIYRLQSDGSIFDKAEAVRAVALVSFSVIEPVSEYEEDLVKLHEEMRNNWELLFTFFTVNNQLFLELCARSFSASLPCFREQKVMQYSSGRSSLRSLCERVILQYPSDLCLISSALFVCSRAFVKKILLELRNWTKNRKTPQLMLNLIRVSQFVSVLFGDFTTIEQTTQCYITYAWRRRMAKLGASMPVDGSTEAVVLEFVKARISVENLLDFCMDFGLDNYEAILQYALKMSKMCSVEREGKIADEMFRLAVNAFQLLTITEDIFLRLYGTLTLLCPYNYRVIELLISEIKKRTKEDEEDQITLTNRLVTLYNFLITIERVNPITESEVKWYQERQKCIEQKEFGSNNLFSFGQDSLMLNASNSCISSDAVSCTNGIYEKPNILQSSLPKSSKFRLPFHVFLFEDEKDIKNVLLPIINAELTLFNVNSWQQLARSLRHLCISKSSLVSGAVMLVVKRHIQNGTTITNDEAELVESLLANSSNQTGIINCLVQGFKSIPLCETKLQLLEIGIRASQKWLELDEVQKNERARSDIEYWLEKLIPGLKFFKTEYLLQKANILKEKTIDTITEPEQLIIHIYSDEIDWSNCRDRDEKLELINEIATIYGLDLNNIRAKLLEEWLPGCSRKTTNCDLNETDGIEMLVDHQEDEMEFRLPYLDESLTKVLHLLNLRDRQQSALSLAAELNKDWSLSSYVTKIRSLCCLLRFCTPNELEDFIQMDISSLCSSIGRLSYGRLIELSLVELPLKTFLDKNKQSLVKSLLSNNYRQTSQLVYLVSCMVVDYELVDRSAIDILLTRLHTSGSKALLIEMLHFCAAHRELTSVRNLVQLWARSADWTASDIDVSSTDAKETLHKFLYFCLSCPLEGGRAFGSLCSLIDNLRLPLASNLIRVAASVVARFERLPEIGPKQVLDLNLKWAN